MNFYRSGSVHVQQTDLDVYTYPSGCTGDSKVPVTVKLFRAFPAAHAKGVFIYADAGTSSTAVPASTAAVNFQ